MFLNSARSILDWGLPVVSSQLRISLTLACSPSNSPVTVPSLKMKSKRVCFNYLLTFKCIPRILDPSSQTKTPSLFVGEFSEEHSLHSPKDLILQGHESHGLDLLSFRIFCQNIDDTKKSWESKQRQPRHG